MILGRWGAKAAWLAVLALGAACSAVADEVHMRNGTIFDAERIDKGDTVWTLHTAYGPVQVRAADVEKVVPRRAPIPEPKPEPDPKSAGTGPANGGGAEATPPVVRRCTPPPKLEYPVGLPGELGGPPAEAAARHEGPTDQDIARSEDTKARLVLIERLVKSLDPAGLPILFDLAKDDIIAVSIAALTGLGAFDQPEIVPFLLDTLAAADQAHYDAALQGLAAWLKRHRATEGFSMADALAAMDRDRAPAFLFAAACVDFQEMRPLVLKSLESSDPAMRRMAVRSMKFFLDKELKPRLDEFLEDPDPGVREETCFACAVYRYKAAMPRLVDMLEDPDPKVAETAHTALKLLSGIPFPAEPDVWRNWLKTRKKK